MSEKELTKEMHNLVNHHLKLIYERDKLELEVKHLNRQIRDFEEHHLPEKMFELGLKEFMLDDGTTFKMKKYYRGSLPKDDEAKEDALDWLKENGFEDLIKTDYIITFGRPSAEERLLTKFLADNDINPKRKRGVHHSTLCGWAQEQDKKGVELPARLLGVRIGQKVIISKNKE